MPDKRYSVMILPRRNDGSILLQTWTKEGKTITDGFGSFFQPGDDPEQIAQHELTEQFGIKADLTQAAQLQYFMDKPTGLVDLKITVYFADVTGNPILQEQMHWFAPSDIPYSQMHEATGKWLPIILKMPELLTATIKVAQPGHHTAGKVIEFTVS
ncbi:MAG TPA: NUDIX hydrolase [Candidatus Saccharimonadales bacterium]|nr:NUDIX hydrolase [Candidatus Saccharimonadales bacterium]